MTQYNTLNVKLSNLQLSKLKSGVTNGTEVTLKLLSKLLVILMMRILTHELFLTNRQVSRLRKAVANNSSGSIKLLKTQFHKIGHSGGILDRLLGTILKTVLPLVENVLKPLAKL